MENRFAFDASSPIKGGRFPKPPFKTEAASELLDSLLEHAVFQSPGLQRRDFRIALGAADAVPDAVLQEVLSTHFCLPAEGWDMPIPTLEHASLEAGVLQYTVASTYAAHLMFASPAHALLLNCAAAARHVLAGVALTDRERDLVITSLQNTHREQTAAWNSHAVYALRNGLHVCSPSEFGMNETASVLRKIGADPAP